MKKVLLAGLASLALLTAASAQQQFVIWNGTEAAAAHSTPYFFGGATISVNKAEVLGIETPYLHILSSDTGSYGGGIGVGTSTAPNQYTKLGYTGSATGTKLAFLANTNSTNPIFKVQFKTVSGKVFGYEWNFSDSVAGATEFVPVWVPVSEFTLIDAATGIVSSTPVPDSLWANTTSEVQFVIGNKDQELNVANLYLLDDVTTGIEEEKAALAAATFAYPNPNSTGILHLGAEKTYTIVNATGSVVASGTGNQINVSTLEKGVYYLRTATKTEKVILY